MKTFAKTKLLAFTATILLTNSVSAGVITQYHDDLIGFNAAVGSSPVTVEDFTSTAHFPISSGVLNSSTNEAGLSPGDIQAGVTYSTPIGTGNFFNIDCCYNGNPFLDTVTSNGPLTVTFDAPTKGFGFNSGIFIDGLTLDIIFSSGASQSFNPFIDGADRFYGFVSSAEDILSAVIGGSSNAFTFAIDDFRFTTGGTTSVSEPNTFVLLGLGLAGLGFVKRRKML